MISRATPLEKGADMAVLSEKHLDKRKHHWFIYKPAPALETRGALSPGSECPQSSLFCSCTEIGLKISGHQLSNSSFPFPHSASGKTWPSGLNLELWSTLGLGSGASSELRDLGSGVGASSWDPHSSLSILLPFFALLLTNLKLLESQTLRNLKIMLVRMPNFTGKAQRWGVEKLTFEGLSTSS